jgi:hypothetical protein
MRRHAQAHWSAMRGVLHFAFHILHWYETVSRIFTLYTRRSSSRTIGNRRVVRLRYSA